MRLKSMTFRVVFAVCGGLLAGALPLAAFNRTQGAGRLPPVGQRAYMQGTDPYGPVDIERADLAQKGAHFLKDPVQPGTPAPLPPARRTVAAVTRRAAPLPRAGQLHFHKLTVQGHLTRPRVEFTRDLLPVDRADEPVTQDFFPKVFAPAQDDSF